MKPIRAQILGMIAVSTLCLPAMAQQAGASAGADASVNSSGNMQHGSAQQQSNVSAGANVQASNSNASASGNGSSATSVAMTPIPAQLLTRLDSKKAKAGDVVEAKTTKTVKTAQGVVIPKGSKLLGTVTEAQAQTKGQEKSMLAVRFDRVQMHNGQQIMVHSVIDNVYKPARLNTDGNMGGGGMMGAGPVGPVGGGMAGARGGLGGGGLVGGAVGGVGNTVGRAGSGINSMAESTGSRVGETATGVTNHVGGTVSGAAQDGTSLTAHAASYPGIMLSGAASSNTTSTLTATGRNIHLDTGTQLLMSVAAAR